ncbi:hypothetical protein GQ457_02G039840 [Hibiscus cannabinus]
MERDMNLQHFSHRHPLIFTKEHVDGGKESIRCSGCAKPVFGPSYGCAKCEFHLHEICTNLPSEINHPFHRDHPLVLLSNPPSGYVECLCDFCDGSCNGFVYHCFSCGFDVHVSCALLPPYVTGEFLELERFSHKHQLDFIEKHEESVCCFGCKEVISGPGYGCSRCEFFLHKKCSMLPPMISHPYHREHPLILLTNLPPYYSSCACDFCHRTCQGFIYHCPTCKFDLDIKCASLPRCIVEAENHRHRFIHLMKPLSFICDACGIEGDRFPYLCTQCQVLVHEECRFLPNTIEIRDHCHPVTQFSFFQGISDSCNHRCGICHDEVSVKYSGYGCLCCNFIAHLNCAVENSVSVIKTKGDEFFDSINDIGEADTIAMVIKHFSHPHNLTLNSKVNDDKLCDCCMKPILEQFYSCEECDIFVHTTCLELPRKKQHPLHPHPLTLLEKHPNFGGLFFCDGCHQRCHGFTYSCEQCEFNLDVRCGSLSNILKHKSHEHPLVFSQGTKCSACGYVNEGLYSCSDCNFALDFACASLPNTTRHKNHEHPLDLTYQDNADQIYCNICEEGIDPNRWFYCCKACDFYGHPKCASEQHPYIKLGRTYPYEAHPHPVAFVHKAKGQPPCSKSGNPCKGLALKCTKPNCSFIIEWCHVEILHF